MIVGKTYYNENNPKMAAWLRALIKEGLISDGDVDDRSIAEVQPADLVGYRRCHFFAGIGGWDYALQLAGWPDDAEVWTGSCPCQPFSTAGKRKGTADERHLWPEFRRLIEARKPSVAFGEQVASRDGREWLAGVFADLEVMGYQRAGADLCAAGVGAPHIRQRLFWVADSDIEEQRRFVRDVGTKTEPSRITQQRRPYGPEPSCCGATGGVADADCQRSERRPSRSRKQCGPKGHRTREVVTAGHGATGGLSKTRRGSWSDYIVIPCGDGKSRRIKPGVKPLVDGLPGRVAQLHGLGNAIVPQAAAQFVSAYMEICK